MIHATECLRSDASGTVLNFSISREYRLPENSSGSLKKKVRIASRNARKLVYEQFYIVCLCIRSHNRSMMFRFGGYGGKKSRWIHENPKYSDTTSAR